MQNAWLMDHGERILMGDVVLGRAAQLTKDTVEALGLEKMAVK